MNANERGFHLCVGVLTKIGSPVNPVVSVVMKNVPVPAEKMRFRDLVLQIERFLKYAPKGTDFEVLGREAREFERRLDAFGNGFDYSKVRKLQEKLRKVYLTE